MTTHGMQSWPEDISRVYLGTAERAHGTAQAWCINERGRIQEDGIRGCHGAYTRESGETEDALTMCSREQNDH